MKKNMIFAEDYYNLEIILKQCVMVVITKIEYKNHKENDHYDHDGRKQLIQFLHAII